MQAGVTKEAVFSSRIQPVNSLWLKRMGFWVLGFLHFSLYFPILFYCPFFLSFFLMVVQEKEYLSQG
jgi:hypothetical protein